MGRLLDGYPWWGQLKDPDPTTGLPDTAATTDCGEECFSIMLYGLRKRYTDAADLRRQLHKPPDDGRTTGRQLVQLGQLHGLSLCDVTRDQAGMKALIRGDVDRGYPVIVLGRWLLPTVLHWYLAIGYGNDALLAMDPWQGLLVARRWNVVASLASGEAVRAVG